MAFVWDMNGLPGHRDVRYGVYINNIYYGLVDANDPQAKINVTMANPDGAYLAVGYYDADGNNQMQGVLDNLRVWNYARMDFSDRNDETPIGAQ